MLYRFLARTGGQPGADQPLRVQASRRNRRCSRMTPRWSTWTMMPRKCLWMETIPAQRRNPWRMVPCWTTNWMMRRTRRTGPASALLRSGKDHFHGLRSSVEHARTIHITHIATTTPGGEVAGLHLRSRPSRLRGRIRPGSITIRTHSPLMVMSFSPRARCRTAACAAAIPKNAKRSRRSSSLALYKYLRGVGLSVGALGWLVGW